MQIAAPIAWQSIEDTLYDWFSLQAGMPVIWGNQDAPQPQPYPFGVMTIISGPNHVTNAGPDETIYTTNLSNPPGEEVKIEFGNQREMTLSLQIFTGPEDSFKYQTSSRSIMNLVQTSLYAPSVQKLFSDAKISVLNVGSLSDLSANVEETWVGQSSMDIVLGLTSFSSEQDGYMSCIEITAPEPIRITDKKFGDCN